MREFLSVLNANHSRMKKLPFLERNFLNMHNFFLPPLPILMNFNNQNRYCHAERSEASRGPSRETLRCAQGDKNITDLAY